MDNNEKNLEKTYPLTKDHLFQPGNPGGPGRPKGSIGLKRLLKEAAKKNNGAEMKKAAEWTIERAKYDIRTLVFLMSLIGDDFE